MGVTLLNILEEEKAFKIHYGKRIYDQRNKKANLSPIIRISFSFISKRDIIFFL